MAAKTRRAAGSEKPRTLGARLAAVRLFVCDVDGILTNGTVVIGNGTEYKQFHIRDGLGLHLLRDAGIKVGWVSNRTSAATTQRALELKIDFLHQQPGNKVAAVETILATTGLTWSEVCFMGDDLVDLGALRRAGVAMTVADGIDEAKAVSHFVTAAAGGQGAVREAVQMILMAQNKWDPLVTAYSA